MKEDTLSTLARELKVPVSELEKKMERVYRRKNIGYVVIYRCFENDACITKVLRVFKNKPKAIRYAKEKEEEYRRQHLANAKPLNFEVRIIEAEFENES